MYISAMSVVGPHIIELVELNTTINEAMCSNEACRRGIGGNYSYSLPISNLFPLAFLTIKFRYVVYKCAVSQLDTRTLKNKT